MPRYLFSFISLFAAVLVLMLGNGLFGSFLSLRMVAEGFSEQTIGLVMGGFYVGLVSGSFFCQRLIQRVGHVRAFTVYAAINTVAVMLQALHVGPFWWGALRVVSGVAMTGIYMVVESWLNECASPQTRGRVFSVYMALTFLGMGGGQFLLNFSDIRGQDLFLIVAVLFTLCLVPVAGTRTVHPELPESAHFNLGKLFRLAPLGMLGCLSAGLANGSFYTLGPVFSHQMGFPVSGVAWYMGITILSGLLLQWPVGGLSDRFNRRLVLGGLSLMVCLISLAIVAAGESSLPLLLGLTAAYGGIAFTIYPVSVALAHDGLERGDIVPVSAALILSFGVGAGIGPVAASSLMAAFGPIGMYLFIAGCSGLFGAGALLYRPRRPTPFEEQVPYVPVPRTSPVITALDPRVEPAEEDDLTQKA
ncbi:MFS transporter [Desulfuromonas versatilis]|uniref:MFS transporter n=1 Tax=Desulfuromonas versatilis TaxID=2802975 RepID=A0ABN6DVN4_9BACT|nr:MFS transporter [Desulfuromonas versatilis]BCR04203.1 MFS transporter [Desulfuromonas versatilis]